MAKGKVLRILSQHYILRSEAKINGKEIQIKEMTKHENKKLNEQSNRPLKGDHTPATVEQDPYWQLYNWSIDSITNMHDILIVVNVLRWMLIWILLQLQWSGILLEKGHVKKQSYVKIVFKQTTISSGSSAGGGGSNLPIRKFSMPVQATMTPVHVKVQTLVFRSVMTTLSDKQ